MEKITEFEKMRSEQMYYFSDPEVAADIKRANLLCARLNTMTVFDDNYREVIQQLIPDIPDSATVTPPFHCDHGNGILLGEDTFINCGCVMLDGAYIHIGKNVKIGPHCQFYTPSHPKDFVERREPKETSYPISIGDDTWLGGGVVVCPGVKIGARCIIGAGAVVVHDIPDDSIAVGNPAQVKV